jgi:hypothetical protein
VPGAAKQRQAQSNGVELPRRRCLCAAAIWMMVKSHGASWRFGGNYSPYGLVRAADIKTALDCGFSPSQTTASLTNTTLRQPHLSSDEVVFALRVEQTWPMAGHPIWKTRSGIRERLGISSGHMPSLTFCTLCRTVYATFLFTPNASRLA